MRRLVGPEFRPAAAVDAQRARRVGRFQQAVLQLAGGGLVPARTDAGPCPERRVFPYVVWRISGDEQRGRARGGVRLLLRDGAERQPPAGGRRQPDLRPV